MGKSERSKPRHSTFPPKEEGVLGRVPLGEEVGFGDDWAEYCRKPVSDETRRLATIAEIISELSSLVKSNDEGLLVVNDEKVGELAKIMTKEQIGNKNYEVIRQAARMQILDILRDLIEGMIDDQKESLRGVLEGSVTEAGTNFLIVATSKDGNGGGKSYHIQKTGEKTKGIVRGDAVRIRPIKNQGGPKGGPLPEAEFDSFVPNYPRLAAKAFMGMNGNS
jgi:hypothetical protein